MIDLSERTIVYERRSEKKITYLDSLESISVSVTNHVGGSNPPQNLNLCFFMMMVNVCERERERERVVRKRERKKNCDLLLVQNPTCKKECLSERRGIVRDERTRRRKKSDRWDAGGSALASTLGKA